MEGKQSFLWLMVISAFGLSMSADFTKNSCGSPQVQLPENWKKIGPRCSRALEEQAQKELETSLMYLRMGAFFARYDVNRPGFSKIFFDKALEVREMANDIISYLVMRGESVRSLTWPEDLARIDAATASEVLEISLQVETKSLENLQRVLAACQSLDGDDRNQMEDYNVVNYFGGEFLERKYKSMKEFADMISTLKKMENNHKAIGEFIYDKKLLKGEA